MNLKESRAEIDIIDTEIVKLLKKRFRISGQIGDEKRNLKLEIEDKKRDEEVLLNYMKESIEELDEEFINELVALILRYSKEVQKK
jgi:chorismate mutase